MTKKKVLTTLALSTIALAQAGYVSADELEPIDSSAPTTEVVTPTAPSASTETETPATQPTEPSVTPVDPTTPGVQGKDNAETPSASTEAPTAPAETPTVPSDTPAAELPQGKDNAENLDGVPAEKPKTTDEANEQGKSQIGTTSTSTGQVVHDVTKEPVETNTGASIVSTENGNVVLSDGSVVAPEEVGGTVNEDKTISVTDKDGKLKTLPSTGTAESVLGAIGAMLLTAVSYFYKKQLF